MITQTMAQAQIARTLAMRGLNLVSGTSVEGFQAFCDEMERAVSPAFRPEGQEEFFWIGGRREGRAVHCQACRLARAESIAQDLELLWGDWHAAAQDGSVPLSPFTPAPIARRFGGRLVYHGDLYIAPGAGGAALGAGLSALLPRLGLLTARALWDPDAVYGIVERRKVWSGVAQRWGYVHAQAGAMRWITPPPDIPDDEWLVVADREDLTFIAEDPVTMALVLGTEDRTASTQRAVSG